MVEPVHPLQGGQFHGLPGFPKRPAVNQLGFVQPVDGLGQSVVVAVATAADRGLYAGLSQPFGVPNGDVLDASIGMATDAKKPSSGCQRALGRQMIKKSVWSSAG